MLFNNINSKTMKKFLFLAATFFSIGFSFAQVPVAIGPQSSTFTGMVRGYFFTAPTTFTICALHIPNNASIGTQHIRVVRFTAGNPPAFPGVTNAFVQLFSVTNVANTTTVACNIPVNAGDVIGVYGARAANCVNSYDGANFNTTINGFATTLRRSGMQACIAGGQPMANIWSEVNFSIGRIYMFYNCCITPTVTATASNTNICQGTQVTVFGGGATTYTWNPGNITTQNANVTPTATTIYSLSGTQNGCTGSATVGITVNPTPTINIVANPPVFCAGSTATLTASGANTYTWNPGGATGNSITISPASSQVYTVTGSSTFGCTSSKTMAVTVNTVPTAAPAVLNSPLCATQTLSLSVNASNQYAWTGPNGFTSNLQNPLITNASPAATGVYSVTVTNIQGCSDTKTVSAVVNALPVPTITSNSPVCALQPINFTGGGGTVYNWTGPSGFTSGSQNPNIAVSTTVNAGTYTLVVTDNNNCSNVATHNVVVNNLPVIAPAGSTVCANQNINLTAGGGTLYAWSGPNGFSSNTQNPTIPNSTLPMNGNYTVTVTDGNGCTTFSIANVVVNPIPTPVANDNSPVCTQQTLSLQSSGGLNYFWTGPNGFSSTLQNPSIVNAPVSASGNYTVTAFDNIGCSATAVVSATVNPLPSAQITASNNKGCVPLCMTFTAINNGAAGIQSANWTFEDGGFASNVINTDRCFTIPGNYTANVVVTDNNNCTNSATYSMSAYPVPTADFNFSPLKPVVNQDAEVTFTDASFGANIKIYDWYFKNVPKPHSTEKNPIYMFTEAGTYAVALTVTSDKGCKDTIVKVIIVGEDYGIYVPNVFTPNGDGNNEIFQPKGYGISKYEIQIFDRWGEIVFSTNDFNVGWDGSYKGSSKIMEGSYAWRISLVNVFGKSHELTGHVILIK